MSTHQSLMIENEIQAFFEAIAKKPGPPKRFKPKVMRKTIKTQRNVFKGQAASRIGKARNPALAARKAHYRKMYLMMKKREQMMYGNMAKAQAFRR